MSEPGRRTIAFALLAVVCGAGGARADKDGTFECLIEASMVVDVASANAGVLDEVLVDRGDRVSRGQPLARLQSSVERATAELARRRANQEAALEAADVRLAFQRKEVARQRKLAAQKHLSERELDEGETEMRLAELRLDELRETQELARLEQRRADAALAMRSVNSPIDGIVVERYRSPGEYVEDQPILKLARSVPLHVEVVLPIRELDRVKSGGRAVVWPEEPVGGRYEAVTTVIDGVIDAATSTFGVRLELPNADRALPAGLRCRVRFLGEGDDSLAALPPTSPPGAP